MAAPERNRNSQQRDSGRESGREQGRRGHDTPRGGDTRRPQTDRAKPEKVAYDKGPKPPQRLALKKGPTAPVSSFLPMSRDDMRLRGWEELDILLISGDAYVDHPAFGTAILGRWLEQHGFRVGVIAQPNWENISDIERMGRPRLFAGVTSGAVDSMLAHYTAFRKKRHDDAYTPGGLAGARPNRAVSVYTSLVRRAFPGLPVVGGGIEASLRRATHYDFWTDSLRKSLLPDAKLDLIVYGMGESAILEIARRLDTLVKDSRPEWHSDDSPKARQRAERDRMRLALSGIAGTARMGSHAEVAELEAKSKLAHGVEFIRLPSHEEIEQHASLLISATLMMERQVHQQKAIAVQNVGDRAVILEPPAPPLDTPTLDLLYALPYTRQPHPAYTEGIPSVEMMLTSMTSHRGCGGGCSFCSLALHQGRRIASRSRTSLLEEAKAMAAKPGFPGAISDVGGPSANMWQARCTLDPSRCKRASCMVPRICPAFEVDQGEHIRLLRDMEHLPGVKHVRVASGVRFDLALQQDIALEGYAGEFTGGQLKVAPEHCADAVLQLMRKPGMEEFERFLDAFRYYSKANNKEQYVIPYLLSGFPGCTDAHMRQLADWLAERNWTPRQVQCFVPTPGTVATAMFYAELDPEGQPLFVAKTDAARLRQHGILLGTARDPSRNFSEFPD